MLKTEVLVRNVTNLHDARYCAGMGVTYISMPLAQHVTKALTAAQINEIGEWLSGIKIFGEIEDTLPKNLQDYVISGFEVNNSQLLAALVGYKKLVALTIEVDNNDLESPTFMGVLHNLREKVTFFNLLCQGSYKAYDRKLLKALNVEHIIFWGFDFDPSTVIDFIDEVNPHGIILQGSKEIKTGLNEFDYLADILEAIDTDEYI